MKRPFAVIGFSMLITSLFITKLTLKMTVALIIGAMVVLCFFILFKKLRKYKIVIFSLVAVVLYSLSFMAARQGYNNAKIEVQNGKEISGVVCQTPTMSDYAFTYVIKCDDENYKIRYVTREDKFLSEGDRVKLKAEFSGDSSNEDFFEYSLSSRIYFTIFERDDSSFKKLSGKDWYYENLGKIKTYFSSVVEEYLPNEAGNIAKAMTVGERSRLEDKTLDYFNCSGTSHLLVISGLHVTMWSLGIFRILEGFIKNKKILVAVSMFTLLTYSAITGFGVSVIRASMLVGMVIISKLFDREADSINSIGLALVIILVGNPFATMSVSLWLTILSTVGILVLSQPFKQYIVDFCSKKYIPVNGVVIFVINSVSISLSTTICTLPVFIIKLRMLPIGSVVANLIMVDLALLLMVLTVVGVLLHAIRFVLFAKPLFIIVGLISDFLVSFAKKIGMADWSSMSVSHKYFEHFLVFAMIAVMVTIVAKKFNKNIVKQVAVVLSVAFVLLTCYTTSYDYNNPSVEILFTDSKPVIVVKSRDTSMFVGTFNKKYLRDVKEILNAHNEKKPDGIIVTENKNETISHLLALYDYFDVTKTYFCNESPKVFQSHSMENVKKMSMGKSLKIILHESEKTIEIASKNKKLLFIDSEEENDFKNIKDYDIIIICGKSASEYAETIKQKNPDATPELYVSEENRRMTIYVE